MIWRVPPLAPAVPVKSQEFMVGYILVQSTLEVPEIDVVNQPQLVMVDGAYRNPY